MTLLLALVCTDGIVMASDGQSTFTTAAGHMRLPGEKIRPLGDRILWGGSGDVGLIQKISVVTGDIQESSLGRPIERLRPDLRARVCREQKAAAENYIPVKKEFPLPVAHVLFAGHDKDRPWILEIDPNGTDTQLEDYRFASVGSGAHFVYAVLSGFGRHPWTLQTGKIVCYKVVHEAINVAAFGLGPPIQIWELPKGVAPRCLTETDIKGVRDTYEGWVQVQLEELGQLTAPPAGPETTPEPEKGAVPVEPG